MLRLLKTIWRKWKAFAHMLVKGQSAFLMGFIYWTTLGPVSMIYRLYNNDPIDRKLGAEGAASYAKPVENPMQDIREAQRPW